jgi:hypothetical protein
MKMTMEKKILEAVELEQELEQVQVEIHLLLLQTIQGLQ